MAFPGMKFQWTLMKGGSLSHLRHDSHLSINSSKQLCNFSEAGEKVTWQVKQICTKLIILHCTDTNRSWRTNFTNQNKFFVKCHWFYLIASTQSSSTSTCWQIPAQIISIPSSGRMVQKMSHKMHPSTQGRPQGSSHFPLKYWNVIEQLQEQ